MSGSYAISRECDQVGNFGRLVNVLRVMEALTLPVKELSPPPPYEVRRFSADGAVVVRDTKSSVFIGGLLIGEFDEQSKDRGPRNVFAVTLAKSGMVNLGRLASAFGITDEYLRVLRRKEEAQGLAGLLLSRQGKDSKVPPELRVVWSAMFAAGRTPNDVFLEQPGAKKNHLSYTTVWRACEQWKRDREPLSEQPATPPLDGQLTLFVEQATAEPATVEKHGDANDQTPDEGVAEIVPMTAAPVRSGQMVQHVGCWLLIALAYEFGLHDDAAHAFKPQDPDGLRIALDAVICALAIYQRCVEGVRRLATPTGPRLLRAETVPTAPGVRKLFGRLLGATEIGGSLLEARVTSRLITAAHADEGPAIFYVAHRAFG